MVAFNERLKQIRNENKVTQKTIADELGITVRAYQHYESGARFPDFQGIIKLADFFNISTDYLIGKSDYPYEITVRDLQYMMYSGDDVALNEERTKIINRIMSWKEKQS